MSVFCDSNFQTGPTVDGPNQLVPSVPAPNGGFVLIRYATEPASDAPKQTYQLWEGWYADESALTFPCQSRYDFNISPLRFEAMYVLTLQITEDKFHDLGPQDPFLHFSDTNAVINIYST